MDEIVIKKGNINDLSIVQKLNQDLFDFEIPWHSTYNREWPYQERGIQFFTDRLNEKDGIIFIAFVNDRPIGYLCGGWLRSYTFRVEKLFSQLDNMFIQQEFRNKGVGKKLLDEFIKWSKEKGVSVIRVDAVYENTKALEFYRKKNFKDHSIILELKIED